MMNIEPRIPVKTADISRSEVSSRQWWREVVLFTAILVAAYFALGWLGEALAARCPDAWEAKFADGWKEGVQSDSPDQGAERVQRIFRDVLAHASPQRNLPYTVHLAAPGNGPNAFAAPGGVIMVTPELLALVESDEGLAFILAHELGHHEHRHVLRRAGRMLMFAFAVALVSQNSGDQVLSSTVSFGELAFSRQQEREADLHAIGVSRAMFGNSEKALEFFEDMVKTSPDRLPAMFSTHPSTKERLQTLRELIAAPVPSP